MLDGIRTKVRDQSSESARLDQLSLAADRRRCSARDPVHSMYVFDYCIFFAYT